MSRETRPPVGRRTALAGLAVVALVAGSACRPTNTMSGAASPSPTRTWVPKAVEWKPCPGTEALPAAVLATMTYDCGRLAVPRDWNDPGVSASPGTGGDLEIALVRARSRKQKNRIGSLLVNPGGPGASGVDLALYLSLGATLGGLPEEVVQRFDIVGFDPRGIKRSSPVRCTSDADQETQVGSDPDPGTDAEFDKELAVAKKILSKCSAKYGDQLKLFSTEQAARDMDAIRAAVGDQKMTYLGYSYGTLLGATYAQLYPKNVRAMVLDGAVDPTQDSVARSENHARGFERAFDNFARWCGATPAKCPIGPDARTAVRQAIDTSRTAPVKGAGGRRATSGWVFTAVISSLYSQSGWERLAAGIAALRTGDPSRIFELADRYVERDKKGHYSNQSDANATVNCADREQRPDLEQVRALQAEWRRKYPLFGGLAATALLSCTYWPKGSDPYPTGRAEGAPPIVVVGTTGDPATPYEQTAKLAGMLGVGRVLTWEGEGHTAYPQTMCVTEAVDAYLIDLRTPAEGLRCPAK